MKSAVSISAIWFLSICTVSASASSGSDIERLLASKDKRDRARAVEILAKKPKEKKSFDLLAKAVNDPVAGIRKKVVAALGRSQRPEAVEIVSKSLSDSDSNVLMTAVYAVLILDAKEGTSAVLRRLDKDRDARVRASILVNIMKKDAYKQAAKTNLRLIERALSDSKKDVRIKAITAYVAIAEPKVAVSKLGKRYRTERDKTVIRFMITKLGDVQDVSAVKLLESIIRGQSGDIRRAGLASLEDAYEHYPRDASAVLVKLFSYSDERIRKSAVQSAAKFTSVQVARKLMSLSEKDPSLQVRASAMVSLGQLSQKISSYSRKIVRHLQRMAGDGNSTIRRSAVQALVGRSKDPNFFKKHLEDKDRAVRTAAFDGLKQIRSKKSGLAIAEVLRTHSDAQVRLQAARALSNFKTYRACRDALKKASKKDRDAGVRREAKRVLAGT